MDRTREIFQGIVAVIVVVGALGLVTLYTLQGHSLETIPPWLALFIGAILGTYFGASNVAGGVYKGTNGIVQAARQIVEQTQAQVARTPTPDTTQEVKQ